MTGHRQTGLTLVEILVSLALIGIMASIVAFSAGLAGRDRDGEMSARQLAGRMQLAVDDALVTRRPYLLSWEEDEYQFSVWSPQEAQYVELTEGPLSGSFTLPGDITLDAGTQDRLVTIDPDGAGQSRYIALTGADGWSVLFDGLTVQVSREGEPG